MTRKELAAIAKHKFFAFPILVSNNQCPPHLKLVSDEIQYILDIKSHKPKLLLISIPPRYGKSELISRHLSPWFLGRFPKKRVILTSYTAELIQGESDAARNIFAKWGPILFNVHPNKTTFSKNKWNTNQGGGVIATGITGTITGFGADLLIIDDYFKGWVEAENLNERDKLWKSWQSIIQTRLHPGSTVIIFATRWNDDDLAGRLIAQEREMCSSFPFEFKYINIPAIAEKNDILNRKEGDVIWKSRFSKEEVYNKKNGMSEYFWSCIFQGRPIKAGGTLFKSQYFRYYTRDTMGNYLCYRVGEKDPIVVRKHDLKIEVYLDPAIETKTKNDPTCMLAWGYSRKHKIWLLLDRKNDRIAHTKIRRTALSFAFKNNAKTIYVENEKLGKIIKKESMGKDEIGGLKIPFREVKHNNQDKHTRAIPMASYYEDERVFHPKNVPWIAIFEINLAKFPQGHDEDADCTAYAANMESNISIAEILKATGI